MLRNTTEPCLDVHDYTCDDDLEINETFLASSQKAVQFVVHPGVPNFHPEATPDATAHVHTNDLCTMGSVNGDWVLIERLGSRRLSRVYANDDRPANLGTVLISPLLLYNLGAHPPFKSGESVKISPTAFGSLPPPLPIANSITVARVASPYSINRIYQPLFIHALKTYLGASKQLLQEGDLIGVPIRTNDLLKLPNLNNESRNEDAGAEDLLSIRFPQPSPTNTVTVFFLVSSINYKPVAHKNTADATYAAATLGELGCWVDPTVTKIVQTGVEHRQVPDIKEVFADDVVAKLDRAGGTTGRLYELCSVVLHPQATRVGIPLSILCDGPRGAGKLSTVFRVAQLLGLHVLEVNCFDILSDTASKTEGTLQAMVEKASSCSPCMLVLRSLEALIQSQPSEHGRDNPIVRHLTETIASLQSEWIRTGHPCLVVATTSAFEDLPASMVSLFKHQVSFQAPNEDERRNIIRSSLNRVGFAPDVSVHSIATQTAALSTADLEDLIMRAKIDSIRRAIALRDVPPTQPPSSCKFPVEDAVTELSSGDLDSALGKVRASYAEGIGAPNIPNVSWDDVGGLASVKADILDTIQLPLDHPELFADGLKKRSGILLYGPPGTGKTLLAKAVATSCSLNFFSVKGPELLNMYIGESEANVRRIFQKARDARPCVIFFDELDSVAPKRGNHGDSAGVMDRIVSQILAELDGMSSGKEGSDVFVIGATNRPDLLDSALLRPGRFDRMLYLGVSSTHTAQRDILEALTRKFTLGPDVNLEALADSCPFHYTGADFYALCSDALLKAMSRTAEQVEQRIAEINAQEQFDHRHPFPMTPQYYLAELATPAEMDVVVAQHDFEQALQALVPSVTESEMAHYASVQAKFANENISKLR